MYLWQRVGAPIQTRPLYSCAEVCCVQILGKADMSGVVLEYEASQFEESKVVGGPDLARDFMWRKFAGGYSQRKGAREYRGPKVPWCGAC